MQSTRICVALILFSTISSVCSLKVLGVVGGGAVVNGSKPLVVMDCHYIIPPGEEPGLVVNWYHGRNPRPVYQWIPGSAPQALGMLRDRLDLKYQSSPDSLHSHSALAFVTPTTELAGEYTCRVTTYFDEGSATAKFTVYTPPDEFDMKMTKPSDGKVLISCKGVNVFPEPNISIFKTDVSTQRRSLMDSKLQKDYSSDSNLHSLTVESALLGHQLIGETQFECLMTIPGTDFRLQETLLYYPGVISSAAAQSGRSVYSNSNSIHQSNSQIFISIIIIAIVSVIFDCER